MTFEDHVFRVDVAGESVPVRVTADVLHLFWGADAGPQTAADLVEAHGETLGTIIGEKIVARDWENGEIVVRENDIDP